MIAWMKIANNFQIAKNQSQGGCCLIFLSISVWRCSYKSVGYKKVCTTLGKMSIEEYCLYHF